MKKYLCALGVLLLSGAAQPSAQQAAGGAPRSGGPPPSIDERTNGMQKIDGYFPLYWDERTGTLLLEIPRFDTEFLFSTGLVGRPRIERHRARPRPGRRQGAS